MAGGAACVPNHRSVDGPQSARNVTEYNGMRTYRGTSDGGTGGLDPGTRSTALTSLIASEPRTIAFDADEYATRLAAVRHGMAARDLDALLLVDPRNVFYLSGVESQGAGHFQCLIVRPDGPL